MAYWLMKSEPETWSWDQQVANGAAGEPWSGVRNHQAKLWLAAMKTSDRAFFYHSGKEKAVVGIVAVIKAAYPDPTAEAGAPWVCVDVKAVTAMKTPVTLKDIKATPALADMILVKNSRFSVQPVDASAWTLICAMGGVKG